MIAFMAGAGEYLMPVAVFENVAAEVSLISSAAAAGTAALNVLSQDTFSGWVPGAAAWTQGGNNAAYVGAKWSALTGFNAICIAAHTLFETGSRVQFDTLNADGTTWVSRGNFDVTSSAPIMFLLPRGFSARGFRVVVLYGEQAPFIGVVRAAVAVEFPADLAAPYVSAEYARRVEVYQGASVAGQFFAPRIKRAGGSMSVQLNAFSRAKLAGLIWFKGHYDAGEPFFWAGCPSVMADDVAFARRAEGGDELRAQYLAGGNLASMSMELDCHGA